MIAPHSSQYSRQQLLGAVFFFSVACAIIGFMIRTPSDRTLLESAEYWIVFAFCPLAIGFTFGAAIGSLRRDALLGGWHGFQWAIVLYILSPLLVSSVLALLWCLKAFVTWLGF